MRKIIIPMMLLLLIALPTVAQDSVDPEAEPAFLTMNLEAGFVLDPFMVTVIGGGSIHASDLSEECIGFINANPTVKVNYTGEADFLRAFFYSTHDPVLIVHTPDDDYLCNDDVSNLLLDPSLDLENPPQGEYKIWVGSFGQDQRIPGFLVFTANPQIQVGTFDLSTLVNRDQMPDEAASVQTLPRTTLGAAAMFRSAPATLDPDSENVIEEITVNGDIPLFDVNLGGGMVCGGFISDAPSYTFNWAGEAEGLRLFFESEQDSTLLVLGPDDATFCNDDFSGADNLNPLVDIPNPAAGSYQVFVGDFDPDADLTGTLTVTQETTLEPEALTANQEE